MIEIDVQKTIGQLVVERPDRARVFEAFGLDYCCGGKKTIGEACAEKGKNADEVLAALREHDAATPPASETDWGQATLSKLVDHIVATHHEYLRRELPRLQEMAAKVALVHGDRHPEMVQVHELFKRFQSDQELHMAKEEAVLFPMCKLLDTATEMPRTFCAGTLRHPIQAMEREHDIAGDDLSEMRRLTNDFTPPPDACNTFRVLLAGLAELEEDMHMHIHKENNILFPRALAKEDSLRAAKAG
ncbi:iron-sulfur cluster repair di-iron protein [Chthonomonas calidirosea]|uniref:iron-sulfur cluster repair di-iron protein n=1 Tax=Chthonomonas calidirosea TaxID=454171 RepID=UPI0006ECADC3|nr:iron-sulfur cluster repair di-iron protein [Chthonomonas calidirosea]CEK15185.1 iron-sulfur cluster repair di-iron protein [Chthonomonas calidirosea]